MDETKYVTWDVHKEFAQRIEDENNRQNHRLRTLEDGQKQIHELVGTVKVLAVNMENMAKEQAKQGEQLSAIEREPADKWKQASWIVVSVILTAIITFALTRIGL